jgi:5-methyltetrahydrofolate--homocysteine methyltransferase
MDTLTRLSESVIAGNDAQATDLTKQALDDGLAAKQILDDGLISGMNVVGQKFKAHEIFLPEVLLAAKAMNAGMSVLRPVLVQQDVPTRGKVVVGTVQGDLHDIGKNLVGIMLKGAGFEVIDLGNDVAPERFVDEAKAQEAPVIGMSALLTTTMPAMKKVVDLVRALAPDGGIKTIVGGAPVSADFAREIGADAYGFDATSAVEQVTMLTTRS